MPDSEGPSGPDRRLALLDELRQAERRAAISRVASVIGHLIGTPLNVIAGRAALIRANPSPEAALENAQRIEQQVERLALRIRRLIDYLTAPEPEPNPSFVASVVDDALALYSPVAAMHGVTIALAPGELPEAKVDGMSAMIVLTSLLGLATRAAPRGSAVGLEATLQSAMVTFRLTVPGLSMPQARLDRLDPPEDADGLDAERLQVLSVCFAIARRHGGRVEFANQEGGAAFMFECQAS
jgi:two-component system, NtrC family, sensor kinase